MSHRSFLRVIRFRASAIRGPGPTRRDPVRPLRFRVRPHPLRRLHRRRVPVRQRRAGLVLPAGLAAQPEAHPRLLPDAWPLRRAEPRLQGLHLRQPEPVRPQAAGAERLLRRAAARVLIPAEVAEPLLHPGKVPEPRRSQEPVRSRSAVEHSNSAPPARRRPPAGSRREPRTSGAGSSGSVCALRRPY